MRRLIQLAGLVLLSSNPGCASADLVGVWDGPSTTVLGTTLVGVVDFMSGGTASYTLQGSGVCNGSLVYSGYHWIADATTITFSGTPRCTGTVKCGALAFDCNQTTLSSTLGVCDYVLDAAGDTLVTSDCSDTDLNETWTRM